MREKSTWESPHFLQDVYASSLDRQTLAKALSQVYESLFDYDRLDLWTYSISASLAWYRGVASLGHRSCVIFGYGRAWGIGRCAFRLGLVSPEASAPIMNNFPAWHGKEGTRESGNFSQLCACRELCGNFPYLLCGSTLLVLSAFFP